LQREVILLFLKNIIFSKKIFYFQLNQDSFYPTYEEKYRGQIAAYLKEVINFY